MLCFFLGASLIALVTAVGFPPYLAWVRAVLVVAHRGLIFAIAAAACCGCSAVFASTVVASSVVRWTRRYLPRTSLSNVSVPVQAAAACMDGASQGPHAAPAAGDRRYCPFPSPCTALTQARYGGKPSAVARSMRLALRKKKSMRGA